MPGGRPKRLFNTHQLHILVPLEDYRALEKGAAREAMPLPDYVRTALHQVVLAGIEVAPERVRRAELQRRRRLEKLLYKTMAELLESEEPAA